MREIEMRQRIEGFLKRRMQGMLAPALGLGLAVAGCTRTSATPVYSAPNPDGPIGHVEDATGGKPEAVYSAPFVPDAYTADAFVAKDTQLTGPDGAPDLATVKDTNAQADVLVPADAARVDVALADAALAQDARKDVASEAGSGGDVTPAADAGVDSGADLGGTITKYMAQTPDAGRDLGAAPLYMAPLYMASIPLG
jgi:hypothetical protein